MAAPTNLPSWRDVNRIVVRSLAASAASAVGEPLAARAADLILARHEQKKLPPEPEKVGVGAKQGDDGEHGSDEGDEPPHVDAES